MIECPECEKEFENIDQLARHTGRIHKIKTLDLWIYFNGERPTCICGCNEETRFINIIQGFSKYKRGHKSRIENPHIHRTKESFEKMSKTRIEMHENGELSAWNKGLTKETDERVERYGINGSKTILLNDKELKNRSERMSSQWKNKNIQPSFGENHPQWKGGSSSVSARSHANNRLYKEWKYPLLESSGFRCQRCDSTEKLEVHHDKETMAEIIHKMTEVFNPEKKDDFDLQTEVVNAVIKYHIENMVSGEVICHNCHKEEHPSYNYSY